MHVTATERRPTTRPLGERCQIGGIFPRNPMMSEREQSPSQEKRRRLQMDPATKKEHHWSANKTIPNWEDVPERPQCTNSKFRYHSRHAGSMQLVLCLNRDTDDNTRTVQLLFLYAVYSAANVLRFRSSGAANTMSMDALLLQFVHQGASTSPTAQHALHRAMSAPHAQGRRLAV